MQANIQFPGTYCELSIEWLPDRNCILYLLSNCVSPRPLDTRAVSIASPVSQPQALVQGVNPTATYVSNTRFIKLAIWAPPSI